MNRQQRRAEAAHRRQSGAATIIRTQTVTEVATGLLYWFVEPDGYTTSEREGLPDGVELHGGFKTHAEVSEDQRLVLLGPQCEVKEGGMWDPAWDRLQ